MARRKSKATAVKVRAYGAFGYGIAFDRGQMHSTQFGDHPPHVYTLNELRKAWAEHRETHIKRCRARGWDRTWAELTFDEGMDPDEARSVIETHRQSRSQARGGHATATG